MALQAHSSEPPTPPTQGPAVHARDLRKSFASLVAVDGIDLDIPRGVCFGLLGPNGAGKTTAIRMVQTVSPRDGGELEVLGMDPTTDGRAIRSRLGVVPQEDNLDPDFTVRDNLRIYAGFFGVRGAAADERADTLLAEMDLDAKRDSRIDQLSGGMKRRLVVARALVHDPEMLILDEPTTGLDPQARHQLWDTIRRLRSAGKTVLLTTHYMDEAETLCDELVIMDQGRILLRGRPRDLVREHCGRDALEVYGDPALLDAAAQVLGETPHERLGDRIIAFGEDLDGLADRMRGLDVRELVQRRATLEDVFLRKTGRALRD